jgi:hypothetical protein
MDIGTPVGLSASTLDRRKPDHAANKFTWLASDSRARSHHKPSSLFAIGELLRMNPELTCMVSEFLDCPDARMGGVDG